MGLLGFGAGALPQFRHGSRAGTAPTLGGSETNARLRFPGPRGQGGRARLPRRSPCMRPRTAQRRVQAAETGPQQGPRSRCGLRGWTLTSGKLLLPGWSSGVSAHADPESRGWRWPGALRRGEASSAASNKTSDGAGLAEKGMLGRVAGAAARLRAPGDTWPPALSQLHEFISRGTHCSSVLAKKTFLQLFPPLT